MSREIANNNFGHHASVHQGDNHYYSSHEDTKCLTDLRITEPCDDKKRIEETKGGLLKDSYRWILEHGDFQQWRDDKCSRLLWIKGDPGKGKTMLLCGIMDELGQRTKPEDQKSDTLLVYFFFQATDSRINNPIAMLRSLIYMLVKQQPSLISHVQERYRHAGKQLFEDANAWVALSGILENILDDPSLKNVYIIIDALDECMTDLPKLLSYISTQSVRFVRVKWVVSSRNWPSITEHLDTVMDEEQRRICLELNTKSIAAAVSIFIKHQVGKLKYRKKYTSEISDAVQRYLISNADNTFLWVALVCQNLEKTPSWKALKKIEDFPPGLDSLYRRMIEQISNLDEDDSHSCYKILATVLSVYRPVTLAELTSLIDLAPEETALLSEYIELCGSFLTVREDRIYVIHQSVKDFLGGAASDIVFPTGRAAIHSNIFSESLLAMAGTLRRNVYNLPSSGLLVDDIKIPCEDPLAAIHYSCVHWLNHFCDTYSNGGPIQIDQTKSRDLQLFFKEYCLYWLEALGLMQHIEDGINALIRLARLFQDNSPNDSLYDLIHDLHRFCQQNIWVIINSPLQIYASAIVFSPFNSMIRTTFAIEEPNWLINKPMVEKDWPPHLQTFRGHKDCVTLATASNDPGFYLALGLNDNTVRLWNVIIGKEQQAFSGHEDLVTSVGFSADSRYIASGSHDETVKIWDILTGKEHKTLRGYTNHVTFVTFSKNGHYLASGSKDDIIIWDARAWEQKFIFKGHEGLVTSIAFSADDCYLASGSSDCTIRIWDLKKGKQQQILRDHTDHVTSVLFSPNDCYLASGSNDRTTKIWNTTTWKVEEILGDQGDWVTSVAFNIQSRYIASGLRNGSINIWDLTTKQQKTLKGHKASIISVAFTVINAILVSGSRDNTVKFWDAEVKEEPQTQEDHKDRVTTLAVSVDGCYLASGSDDCTIKIWDAETGRLQQTIEAHEDPIASVAFSDDRILTSKSRNGAIKAWDTVTWEEISDFRVRADSSALPNTMIADNDNLVPKLPNCIKDVREAENCGYGLSADNCWITWNQEHILWLPYEYRPSISTTWSYTPPTMSPQTSSTDTIMALGISSGKVVIMRMTGSGPCTALQSGTVTQTSKESFHCSFDGFELGEAVEAVEAVTKCFVVISLFFLFLFVFLT